MDKGGKSGGGTGPCPMENVSSTIQSLDTVRALHQTVVSLRTALEDAKHEIQRLRSQITISSDIKEGTKNRETVETPILSPLERIRPAPISTTRYDESRLRARPTTFAPALEKSEDTAKTAPPSRGAPLAPLTSLITGTAATARPARPSSPIPAPLLLKRASPPEIPELKLTTPTPEPSHPKVVGKPPKPGKQPKKLSLTPKISITATPRPGDKSKGMASQIDVKIKVMSDVKMDGSSSDTSSASQMPSNDMKKDEKLKDESKIRMKVEDKLTIRKSEGVYHMEQTSRESVLLEDQDNSQSDGDNSVFLDEKSAGAYEDCATGGDTSGEPPTSTDAKEEVDDIELIFSSDENREVIQEDLVSISEYDPWQAAGATGTPVLVKFASLPSDQEDVATTSAKKGKIPISASHDVFLESELSGYRRNKAMDSVDSFDNQRSPKSSLEKDNSDDLKDEEHPFGRDESLDFFEYRDAAGPGRKWTNHNVLVETDISKCGIIEETSYEMYRRNTCPNPPAYRPVLHREPAITTRHHIPSRLASRYSRRHQFSQGGGSAAQTSRPILSEKTGPKRSSSAQTDISALPEHWKSETQLAGDRYHLGGPCTLPSKFVPTVITGCHRHSMRTSDRTQEARRILLSDINFTSMVPELSRSADHLCQNEGQQETANKPSSRYYKGNLLKTPDYAIKGITPSASMTSPGVSQWTVNENSFGTQTIQTGESWGGKRGDSFDSCRSYSIGSRYSGLDRHHRSRSVPSVRCGICKQAHGGQSIRTSESMHYTPRVTFQEPACKIRGSLPDLRHDCVCYRRYTGRSIFTIHGDSSGSTESLLDEADTFVRKSMDGAILIDDTLGMKRPNLRRMSENDIQRDYVPSKQALPFLPRTAKCLKPGHLAKVIAKNGRVIVGRVRYVGPLNSSMCKNNGNYLDDLYVGVQLQSKCGDCDGSFNGKKFFDCEPLQGLFVPFKKVVMAWTG